MCTSLLRTFNLSCFCCCFWSQQKILTFFFLPGWLKHRIGQNVNTHRNPNPFLTLEMSTTQTEATQARWLHLLHATLVGKSKLPLKCHVSSSMLESARCSCETLCCLGLCTQKTEIFFLIIYFIPLQSHCMWNIDRFRMQTESRDVCYFYVQGGVCSECFAIVTGLSVVLPK